MPMRPAERRAAADQVRAANERLEAAVHGGVARAIERRRSNVRSLDAAARDRRARESGTLADVRAIEDDLLRLAESRGQG